MANQITGRIELIRPTETIPSKDGSKSFQKRELILDATRHDPYTGERGFDNFPSFEFGGDRCADLDSFQKGQVVTVSFDVSGMRYPDKATGETKYFTKVRGYKIELKGGQTPVSTPPTAIPDSAPTPKPVEEKDDLPF